MKNIYFFQWPSDLGGADTRLKELIQLFAETKNYNLFCIPNDNFRLNEQHNVNFLNKNNVKILTWETLPEKAEGFAIAFCNFRLFSEEWRINKIKSLGLKFIWSNDMMWTTTHELSALKTSLIDTVIFTSLFHRRILTKDIIEYNDIQTEFIPNYFHYENYKEKIKKPEDLKNKFVFGKLARADFLKYSENFPLFFDKVEIQNKHIRIMGWNQKLYNKYKWFDFNKPYWELLDENKETSLEFLSKLDLYVFNCNHQFTENQSRSVIEAQLLGIPVIAPNLGNFPNMIWHGRTGFVHNTIEELYQIINKLYYDKDYYKLISENARNISKHIWCNKNEQLRLWEKLFN